MTNTHEPAAEIIRGVLARVWNSGALFDTRTFPDEVARALHNAGLLTTSPAAAAAVAHLREELEALRSDMRRQPSNILADEVSAAITIILNGTPDE